MIKSVHPFPARMGPDLAIDRLKRIKRPSVVLDPMVGSGTVLRHATELGHSAIGRDLDPLAILMTKVWTTPIERVVVEQKKVRLLKIVEETSADRALPWIDDDPDTKQFVEFWFGAPQRNDLRRLAHALRVMARGVRTEQDKAAMNVLRLALSRIIVTKDSGASLGRDISHSRPHKVTDSTPYDVLSGYSLSVNQILDRLTAQMPPGRVKVELGDARYMADIPNESVDVVLTSPPYLNAIDYIRGHRLALVWLGHQVGELRKTRAISIGSERGPEVARRQEFGPIFEALGEIDRLPSSDIRMVGRYCEDIYRLMAEMARVLNRDGRAFLVVGNSCLRKVFIRNSEGFIAAGRMIGLRLSHQFERDLPTRKRYLPIPKGRKKPLGERMRTETILSFKHD
jgi:SAM-dependent methyltransferase